MNIRANTRRTRKETRNTHTFSPQAPSTTQHSSMNAQIAILQRKIGNHAVGNLIQRQLKIGRSEDPLEREADRVAEQILRMPSSCNTDLLNGLNQNTHTATLTSIQRAPGHGETMSASPVLEKQVQSLRGGGMPLPNSEKNYFEPRFGQNFDKVRIHTGLAANQSAAAINARAYTLGKDIVFDHRGYRPGTFADRHLLAHELTHVIQQTGPQTTNRNLQRTIQRQESDTPQFPDFFGFTKRLKFDIDSNLFAYRHQFMHALTLSEAHPNIMEDTFLRFAFDRDVLESSFAFLGFSRDTAEILSYAGGLTYMGAKFATTGEIEFDYQLPVSLGIPGISDTFVELNLTVRPGPSEGDVTEAHAEDIRLQGGLGAAGRFFGGVGFVGHF